MNSATQQPMTRPRMLILSFSNIAGDGRVLRQIEEFSGDFEIITCGAGETPPGSSTHVRIEHSVPTWARHAQGVALHLRAYAAAYWLVPYVRAARRRLNTMKPFDVIIANDLPAAGVAAAIAPKDRIVLDLHEYWPGLHDDVPEWTRLRAPYFSWLLRTYGSRAAAHTTVSESIAHRYRTEFGFDCRVVANASVLRDLSPTTVGDPVRLVHSGIAKPARRIDLMMRAVAASGHGATLDLYLTGVGSAYHAQLLRLSEELGERIRVREPVPQAELIETLNQYDVGLPFLPPTTTNIRLCLPNKFFDYVQARLAIITGPTEAMAELVTEHGLGTVTASFDVESLTEAIDALTPENVKAGKHSAAAAAPQLAGEHQLRVWRGMVEGITGRRNAT